MAGMTDGMGAHLASDDDGASDAPGWDAITGALETLYPGQEPSHFAAVLPAMLGGNDPLNGISAYASQRERAHWHLVTYGFSALYGEAGADPGVSGYGFELTLRVARSLGDQPPAWAVDFLQNLARYVFRTGNVFAPGHYMDLKGPIMLGSDTAITGVIFAGDPELAAISTLNGRVAFIQIVGVTQDERETAARWNSDGVLDLLRAQSALLVTDLDRGSTLAAPAAQAAVLAGQAAEASSTAEIFVEVAHAAATSDGVDLTLGASAVGAVLDLLPRRLAFEQGLTVLGPEQGIIFTAADECSARATDLGAEIRLDGAGQAELASVLRPAAGSYSFEACPGLRITVIPSVIRDGQGNPVETIG